MTFNSPCVFPTCLTQVVLQVRKIRCDALPEGCSHCLNQNLECYVTDRVSGRTERRGYMQELEREKTDMMTHMRELEKKLQNNGIPVKPWHSTSFPATPAPEVDGDGDGNSSLDASSMDLAHDRRNQPQGSAWVKTRATTMPMGNDAQPAVYARPLHAHLGVANENTPLSSIKGTTLSILGSTIDIGSFDAPDLDEPSPSSQARTPLYNKSIHALLQSAFNVNPPLRVDFPPRSDAFTYAEWYFVMIHPFHPVLHKPTFMSIVS